MGSTRTAWHVLFAALLTQRGPEGIEVRSEVPLSTEPLRADYLLLRKPAGVAPAARTLRRLWELLPSESLVELKSSGRPYRRRNLHRLGAYLHLHYADQAPRIAHPRDLCGVLLVPARTPSLLADALQLGLAWWPLGGGYWRLRGGPFGLIVGEIDVIAEADDDDLLRLFTQARTETPAGRMWLSEQVGAKEIGMEIHEMEGYDEVIQKVVSRLTPEQRLAGLTSKQRVEGLTSEQRVEGLTPEQRAVGLAPEERILLLPDSALRGFSDDYLATLPEPTRAAIRARIGR